ncbi:MAG: hypothetical protein Q9159_006757 [Coniocarpon cinnabarinum]
MLSSFARGLSRKGSSILRVRPRPAASRPLLDRDGAPADDEDMNDTEAGGGISRFVSQQSDANNDGFTHGQDEDDDDEGEAEDLDGEDEPLLPIFSAAHLDSIPVFTITHNIRLLIDQKCETTLSWEQLRSPQISQFLVKPIQNDIISSHWSRASLYALLANSLQFKKEGQLNPGIVGVCNTRALLAELLAIRLLKEYDTRELIDALSYDFDPLSGLPPSVDGQREHMKTRQGRPTGRTSSLEVAIRAEAKKFLSHPLVVSQLSSIWAGAIVFHSAADSLHRYPSRPKITHGRHYGATYTSRAASVASQGNGVPKQPAPTETIRRSVTIYDPSDASPFKLSRLRVPRYRQIASTVSYVVMLFLFLTVLSDRSLQVTGLEVVFWFWSLGYMLDEIVGFSEQGFGLYIASVWNALDIGILTLFFFYYVLRISGAIVTASYKERMAHMAYDVLASSAVLLFPRAFSILDHFRYFSQLLVAFRLMFRDLAAVLILIIISCSGFFVAFTYSFSQEDFDGRGVVYALFQILMGFTPAAWDVWPDFNPLGKMILAVFLIVTHFLVVTILISVLTNSFMGVVKNANEEHQYLFAINTISAVKSDALFSYVAPANCFGFLLAPLRYFVPFHRYVLANRTVIKGTHFPILFIIWAYEKVWLARSVSEPVEHVERRGRTLNRMPTFALVGGPDPFRNAHRMRMPSSATYQKDRALEEVFKRALDGSTTVRKPYRSIERKKTDVDHWMNGVGDQGGASPPFEQPRSVLEQLEERRRPRVVRANTSQSVNRRIRSTTRSAASDPDDPRPFRRRSSKLNDSDLIDLVVDEPAEADDELNSIEDEQEQGTLQQGSDKESKRMRERPNRSPSIRFRDQPPPSSVIRHNVPSPSPAPGSISPAVTKANLKRHTRDSSAQTILFNPVMEESSEVPAPRAPLKPSRRRASRPVTALKTIPSNSQSSVSNAKQPPKRPPLSRPRPVMPPRGAPPNKSSPNVSNFLRLAAQDEPQRRAPSYDAIALDLASDIGDNRNIDPALQIMSSSFHTQMMRGLDSVRQREQTEETDRLNRIILSRMNNLEEGFKDVVKEMRDWRNTGSRTASTGGEDSASAQVVAARAKRRAERQAQKENDPTPRSGPRLEKPQSEEYKTEVSIPREDPFRSIEANTAQNKDSKQRSNG